MGGSVPCDRLGLCKPLLTASAPFHGESDFNHPSCDDSDGWTLRVLSLEGTACLMVNVSQTGSGQIVLPLTLLIGLTGV